MSSVDVCLTLIVTEDILGPATVQYGAKGLAARQLAPPFPRSRLVFCVPHVLIPRCDLKVISTLKGEGVRGSRPNLLHRVVRAVTKRGHFLPLLLIAWISGVSLPAKRERARALRWGSTSQTSSIVGVLIELGWVPRYRNLHRVVSAIAETIAETTFLKGFP